MHYNSLLKEAARRGQISTALE